MSRILVVEDEAILRKNIVDRLRAEGHELFDTATAESAEQLASSRTLILADLRLPGMDGMALLQRVRKFAAYAGCDCYRTRLPPDCRRCRSRCGL
ncbi:MAG: response regulator [Planctomycetes bacterium]|nr:response regulator [Planctomycetota bacterium]